jgi:hypothetical protein
VNVRQIVVLVVDQVQTNDDAVEHGNDGHGVVFLVSYWRQFIQSIMGHRQINFSKQFGIKPCAV